MNVGRQVLERREEILRVAEAHHATNVRLIGSVARGDSGPGSDVDFVVHFLPGADPRDRAAMARELERLLGRQVDVIPDSDLHASTRERLRREAISL
jgi:predicted nucleotidyltransferase